MCTTIKIIMTAVAIGMWIGPRSVFIAFVVRKIGLAFDVLTDLNATQDRHTRVPISSVISPEKAEGLTATASTPLCSA
jgi:hypothetical protein